MTKLLVIADDFTGALDTGIQFAQNLVSTRVFIWTEPSGLCFNSDSDVVVIDSETRHLLPGEAYNIIYKIMREAAISGIKHIYKKTDSCLRGCIGSELQATLDAFKGLNEEEQSELFFVPAFPKAGRTTLNGIQYVNGIPVSESVFGSDPFDPVINSYIPDIIAEQTPIEVVTVPIGADLPKASNLIEPRIILFDACTDNDLHVIAKKLNGKVKLTAGCAGFASHLREMIEFPKTETGQFCLTKGIFVLNGSLNPVSNAQVRYAEEIGFNRYCLTANQKVMPDYLATKEGLMFINEIYNSCISGIPTIIDASLTVEENNIDKNNNCNIDKSKIREAIALRLGEFAREWVSFGLDHTLVMIGGDTLAGFMKQIGCNELTPIHEFFDGVVCSILHYKGRKIQVVSKAGGFGERSVLIDIANKVLQNKLNYKG